MRFWKKYFLEKWIKLHIFYLEKADLNFNTFNKKAFLKTLYITFGVLFFCVLSIYDISHDKISTTYPPHTLGSSMNKIANNLNHQGIFFAIIFIIVASIFLYKTIGQFICSSKFHSSQKDVQFKMQNKKEDLIALQANEEIKLIKKNVNIVKTEIKKKLL